ncbi:hypothetical protein RhiirC2_762244 [Rhizophagus irregularis]|uniref:Uncharacterized protein n=1 Tax=Rhizophagus irregularis TaxID=588596 RepID=A0A2N1ME65_9GLOM|nr:hypothetical protein RhiirC2_762244 [Rhizophagus irregularis]
MPLRTCGHNTIDIVEIVVPECLIRSSFFLICLERTFKLRQIPILILQGFPSVIHRRSSRLLIA